MSHLLFAAAEPAENAGRPGRAGSRALRAAALPAEIADKIQRISDTELAVDRSVIGSGGGAQVRDARAWAGYLTEAIDLYGD